MNTLQVGRTYTDFDDNKYLIAKNNSPDTNNDKYPFVGFLIDQKSREYFTADGKYFSDKRPHDSNLIVEEYTTIVPHLDVIIAFMEKKVIQFQIGNNGSWYDYNYCLDTLSPVQRPEYSWRVKPPELPKRTVQIGTQTVIAPEIKAPNQATTYYYCNGRTAQGIVDTKWYGDDEDKVRLNNHNVFLNKQDAIKCVEAIAALFSPDN